MNKLFLKLKRTVHEMTVRGFALMVSFLASAAVLSAQSGPFTVTGSVIDQNGSPVIGAAVMVLNSSSGTTTDVSGKFTLPNVKASDELRFSSLGYADVTVKVGDRKTINVTLQEDADYLDEVVVIGYGTQKRKNLIGAVDQMNSEVVENRAVNNVMQALQGASANLIIQQRNANPNNSTMNVNIRGISTINNNDPLVIIDGIITDLSALNRLNPEDIESVSVLKDAGSAAIYGSRSSSGVLLVTTKTGSKNEKPTIRFNADLGWEVPEFYYKPVKGYENAILRNMAQTNVGNNPEFTPEQIRDIYNHEDSEYQLFMIFEPALQQRYSASVSGGGKNVTYMVSGSYYNQDSNYIDGDYGKYGMKRYNFRSNVGVEYGRLKLTTQIAFNRTKNFIPNDTNAIQNATRWPVYYYNTTTFSNGNVVQGRNADAILKKGGYRDRTENGLIGNINAEIKIADGFKAKFVAGLDLSTMHRFSRSVMFPFYATEDATTPSGYVNANRQVSDYNQNDYLLTTQFLLDYNKTLGKVHDLSALLGVSNESNTQDSNQAILKYADNELGTPAADGLSEFDPSSYNTPKGTVKTSINSLFGRLGYSYTDRYYTEFSFRYDGSSKFAKDVRWGFFPSVSAGWRLSQEKFMKVYREKVGDLKFRASYGILGNQNVGNYKYLTTYTINTNVYGFGKQPVSGVNFSFANPALKWERSANLNVGIDASFFKNALSVSADWFTQTTSDILMPPEVPAIYGGAVATENTGTMKNRGWELTVNYKFETGNVFHRLNFNLSDAKNEVTDFPDDRINTSNQYCTIIREGYPLNSYFGLKVAGLFQSEEEIAESALPSGAKVQPGDVKYEDVDKNGVIDDNDRQILGNAFPRYTFGFKYNLQWKGLDFSVMIQGVGKREMMLRGEKISPFQADFTTTMFTHQLDFWTPDNRDAQWPRLTASGSSSNNNNYGMITDLYMLDAAYLRVKNIQIGYRLPEKLVKKVGLSKARLFMNAENPFTFSATKFFNPESSEFGNSMGGLNGASGGNFGREYPSLQYYGFGINLEF